MSKEDVSRLVLGRRHPLDGVPVEDLADELGLRELEQEFVPDYDALSMPSADKRAAYALEHIAFRVGKIDQSLAKIAAAIEALLAKS